MRMWGIDPTLLCDRHLLGEHVEMHMFIGTIKKGISISGYIKKGLVNPNQIKQRHDLLAKEMISRGMTHKSPLDCDCTILPVYPLPIKSNIKNLKNRCSYCNI